MGKRKRSFQLEEDSRLFGFGKEIHRSLFRRRERSFSAGEGGALEENRDSLRVGDREKREILGREGCW